MFLINPYILQASGGAFPSTDLLAYYTADNTPNDALGTYNGTLTNGATYGTGIINQGFSLDGVNDYVSVSPSLGNTLSNYSAEHSYAAWVYPDSLSTYNFIIQNANASAGSAMVIRANGALAMFTRGGAGVFGNLAGQVTTSAWSHVCATYASGTIKFYVNGVLVDTVTPTAWSDDASAKSTYIGSYLGSNYYFNGEIDELGVWNRELTASEVTDLYNSGAGLQYPTGILPLWSDLLAYYTADNTPNDALGNYNGTLTNGATYGTGIINQGFSLDGVNDYVDLGNNLDFDGSTPFSISTWINASVINGDTRLIFGKGSAARYWFYLLTTGEVGFMLHKNPATNELRVTTIDTLSTSTWYNLVVTYDGSMSASGVSIYINGVDKTLTTNYDTLVTSISNTKNAVIGSSDGSARYFNGIIDEVGIWDRELTSSEVTELYNSGSGLQY